MSGEATNDVKKQFGLKMRYKILLTMILVSLIPLSGLWYISVYKNQKDATGSIYEKLSYMTSQLSAKVDDWYSMNLLILQQNSELADIKSMEGGRQVPALKTINGNFKWVYLAFTVDANGENIGRSDGQPAQQYGDREYYKEIMNGQLVGQQVAMGKTSGKPALMLAVPVYGFDNQRKGILAHAMTLEDLSKSVTDVSLGKTGYAILLDTKNRVIARGKGLTSELQDLSADPIVNFAAKSDGQPFVYEENGKRIIASSKATRQGWKVMVRQDYDEAFAVASQTRQSALVLLFVTLAAVALVAFFLAAGLAGPIKSLTQVSDSMSRGELDISIKETQRQDEIGELARAIERMGISLQLAFKRMRK